MNFKFAFVFVAVALCAAEASRNVRSVDSIINKARDVMNKGLSKVKEAGENALKKGMNAVDDLERVGLAAGSTALKAAGINVDLSQLSELAKSNIKGCAKAADIKEQAKTAKNSILSCVSGDIERVKVAVNDIKNLIKGADDVPKLLDNAKNSCSKGNFFKRIANCAKAVANVATEGNLTGIPTIITKHISTITGIVDTVKNGAASCIKGKLVETGSTLASLSKNLAECAKDGATEAALPALAGFAEAAGSFGNIAALMG